jgi:hypothetical protein
MSVRQAIQLTIYTTPRRSLKRDETAEYIRLLRAAGEGDPDTVTVMRDEEDDGLEGDRGPMESTSTYYVSVRYLLASHTRTLVEY